MKQEAERQRRLKAYRSERDRLFFKPWLWAVLSIGAILGIGFYLLGV
jgi:hypothetical protein